MRHGGDFPKTFSRQSRQTRLAGLAPTASDDTLDDTAPFASPRDSVRPTGFNAGLYDNSPGLRPCDV